MDDRGLQRLGKYDILEKIGAGAFADVYRARDTALERTVALKIPAPFLLRDPGFIDRFQREARAAASLKHPNIVAMYDLGEIEGVYYIAMEYLPGRTLGDLIKEEGALPLDRALDITEQVAEALDYAHAQGLVHRDVKPSNIIVDDEGHATLTDFGLVKAMAEASLTSKGAIVGTPEYMSPEQAEGKPTDKRSDIYSLGIVVYQMLTGQVPFSADSTPARLYAQVHTPPPPPSELAPDIPEVMEAPVLKALAKAPEDRYQTAAAFMAALKTALEREMTEARMAPVINGKERRNRRSWVAGATAILVLVALGLIFSCRLFKPGPMESTLALIGGLGSETPVSAGTALLTATRVAAVVDTSAPTHSPTASATRTTPTPHFTSVLESTVSAPTHEAVLQYPQDIWQPFAAPAGTQPNGLAWDGSHLWMSSYMNNGGIYKIDASDGSVRDVCTPPVAKYRGYGGLAFDGTHLWEADAYGGGIFKIDVSDCSVISSITSPDTRPSDLAWDGADLWVCGYPSEKMYKIEPNDGSILAVFEIPQGISQANAGLTFDGTSLWLSGGSEVFEIDPSDGHVVSSIQIGVSRPESLAWDGEYLWVASFDEAMIYRVRP